MSVDQSELDVFIIVHDQELLLAAEEEGRFAALPRYRYLFVGARGASGLNGLSNVIVARELPDNIECWPHLLSFTGWYAVARNGLARAPRVALLEYDVQLAPDFLARTSKLLRATGGVVGYVPFPFSHPMYLHATPWLILALREAHGLDLPTLIREHLATGGEDAWAATTNASLPTPVLEQFVDWFLPVTKVFRHDPIGAHVHERALPVFCLTSGLRHIILPGALEHRQERSHGIFARTWDEAQKQADDFGTCPAKSDL